MAAPNTVRYNRALAVFCARLRGRRQAPEAAPVAGRQKRLTILNTMVESDVHCRRRLAKQPERACRTAQALTCKLAKGLANRRPDLYPYPAALADIE